MLFSIYTISQHYEHKFLGLHGHNIYLGIYYDFYQRNKLPVWANYP